MQYITDWGLQGTLSSGRGNKTSTLTFVPRESNSVFNPGSPHLVIIVTPLRLDSVWAAAWDILLQVKFRGLEHTMDSLGRAYSDDETGSLMKET